MLFENIPPLRGEQLGAFLSGIDSSIYNLDFPSVLGPQFLYSQNLGHPMLCYMARCLETLLCSTDDVAGVVHRHGNLNERLALAFALQLQKDANRVNLKVIGIDGSSGFRFTREGIFAPSIPNLLGDTLITVRGFLKPGSSIKEEAEFFRKAFGADKKLLALAILNITKPGHFDNLALPVEVRSLMNSPLQSSG